MRVRVLLAASAAVVLTASAGAGETRIERSQTCVCTSGQGPHAMPPIPPMPPVPPVPPVPPIPPVPGAGWQGMDGQNVTVFGDGGHGEQVIVIRRHDRVHDSADANNDGKVTRREFLDRAERHFKERDKNGDGKLDEGELAPMPHRIVLPPAAQQD